jgi:hypothetical protein
MDKVVAVLQIIAGARSLVPGLGLIASLRTPEGKTMAFVVDSSDPKFQAALDVIASWESARPIVDHRPGK